ncbi:MAG: aconitase X catalytic domain-containing protein [Rhodospirillaceae bacterium]|nr:aconitase X catalytic domain-containing protein [Rhodospirillaceae bacterium]
MELTTQERAIAGGAESEAAAMAMRIVAEAGRLLGAPKLIEIASVHVDGCLYHGDSGVHFAEKLVADGGKVQVPTTLNVGALDLLHPERVRGDAHFRDMARRLMDAHLALGCTQSFTCAPYQTGHRPALGEQVAWGESNAVAFANSVLGARTNRYGDFLDICAAIAGRAPYCGLHLDRNRRAQAVVSTDQLSTELKNTDAFYPVLGAWLGATFGETVAVVDGLPPKQSEDRLKAVGAGAASTGAIGLFHIAGVTPEAPTVEAVCDVDVVETVPLTPDAVRETRDRLSTVSGEQIDALAVGSPHFSRAEFAELAALARGRRFGIPFFACTGRDVIDALDGTEDRAILDAAGLTFVADTCVVVAPILPESGGVLMTNSAKFAHYGPANTGFDVVYGSLADCVESAVAGRVVRDETLWR